jgi:3-methyladenine DNA glycosylase Tag
MRAFAEILAMAAAHHGGPAALEAELARTPSLPPAKIAATPDDRILSLMTKRVFYAGFSSKVIDAKWPAFEAAFHAFDPIRCAALSEDAFDALTHNPDIVRNGAKIASVPANARLVLALAADHGSAAAAIAAWPDSDYVRLLEMLAKRGSRLGGETAMRFLRDIGKPAFIPTADVAAALVREGVLTGPPKGKRDLRVIQIQCDTWAAESGRSLTEISRVLAMSVGPGEGGRHRR